MDSIDNESDFYDCNSNSIKSTSPEQPAALELDSQSLLDVPCFAQPVQKNVVVIRCPDGSNNRTFVVGTAHASKESVELVRKTIQEVRPEAIIVELCHLRVGFLTLTKEDVINSCGSISNILKTYSSQGAFAAIYSLCLYQTGLKLDTLPGGEFKAAFEEAVKLRQEGHRISFLLGDRPSDITLKRMWLSLSVWKKLLLLMDLLYASVCGISAEDIDSCLNEDVMMTLANQLEKRYPTVKTVLVDERDKYLAYKVYEVMKSSPTTVAVVGYGHIKGIQQVFQDDVRSVNIDDLMSLPQKESLLTRETFTTVSVLIMAAVAFVSFPLTHRR